MLSESGWTEWLGVMSVRMIFSLIFKIYHNKWSNLYDSLFTTIKIL